MHVSDFNYDLPPELIAQQPAPQRGGARLLVVDRSGAGFCHRQFFELPALLPSDSLLVFNNTRVIPARLHGRKTSGGKIEILLMRREPGTAEVWQVLCKGGHNVRPGTRVEFAPQLYGEWKTKPEAGQGVVEFFAEGDFWAVLKQLGEMPLPPYIKRQPGDAQLDRVADQERYQTVYAKNPGAIAAPTAGLHFTQALLDVLVQRGIEVVFLTLHVGIGTFQSVRVEQVESHTMEAEDFIIDEAAARRINQAKAEGRKLIAVGTTTTRALESAGLSDGYISAGRQQTRLFIYPGFRFRIIDGLITNFHLPRSTLLMLVSAFAGHELIRQAYAEAIAQRYRFYSYGDAMLIL